MNNFLQSKKVLYGELFNHIYYDVFGFKNDSPLSIYNPNKRERLLSLPNENYNLRSVLPNVAIDIIEKGKSNLVVYYSRIKNNTFSLNFAYPTEKFVIKEDKVIYNGKEEKGLSGKQIIEIRIKNYGRFKAPLKKFSKLSEVDAIPPNSLENINNNIYVDFKKYSRFHDQCLLYATKEIGALFHCDDYPITSYYRCLRRLRKFVFQFCIINEIVNSINDYFKKNVDYFNNSFSLEFDKTKFYSAKKFLVDSENRTVNLKSLFDFLKNLN